MLSSGNNSEVEKSGKILGTRVFKDTQRRQPIESTKQC